MTYQATKPAEAIKALAKAIWHGKESLRPLVRGFAASDRNGSVTIYLSQPLTGSVEKKLKALSDGADLEFESVGSFHFTNVGAKLRRREGYSGRLAALVKGGDGRHYALTCGHVLQGVPRTSLAADVLIAGNHHPAKFAVKTVFNFKSDGENLVDAGLAELYPSAIAPHNLLPDGTDLPHQIADPAEGDGIRHAIPQGKAGVIESIASTLLVTVGTSEVILNDMIIAKSNDGSQFVQQGDSGSLFVRSGDKRPLGMLLGKAKSVNGGPSDLAIICPLKRTLDALSQLTAAKEHYPGPYTLV